MAKPTIQDVHLDEEFRSLNREPTEEERKGLTDSIKLDGVEDSLRIWLEGDKWLLVDGYRRYDTWRGEGGDDPKVKPVPSRLTDRGQVIDWAISYQLDRRNLGTNDRTYLEGKRYNGHKLDPDDNLNRGAASGENAENTENPPKGHNVPSGKKRKKRTSSGKKRKTRAGKFATAVDEIAKNLGKKAGDDIRAGVISKKATIAIAALPAKEQGPALARAKLGKPVEAEPELKDDGGRKVPDNLSAVFSQVERLSTILNVTLPKMTDAICEIDEAILAGGKLKTPAEALYKSLHKLLSSFRPAYVCSACSGGGCKQCQNRGYKTAQ